MAHKGRLSLFSRHCGPVLNVVVSLTFDVRSELRPIYSQPRRDRRNVSNVVAGQITAGESFLNYAFEFYALYALRLGRWFSSSNASFLYLKLSENIQKVTPNIFQAVWSGEGSRYFDGLNVHNRPTGCVVDRERNDPRSSAYPDCDHVHRPRLGNC